MSSELVDASLVAAITAVLLVPIARRVRRKRFDPFEPIVLCAAAYGVMLVVRPAAMLAKDSPSDPGPRTTIDVSATFAELLATSLFGAVSFRQATFLAIGLAAVGIGLFALFLAFPDRIATIEAVSGSPA